MKPGFVQLVALGALASAASGCASYQTNQQWVNESPRATSSSTDPGERAMMDDVQSQYAGEQPDAEPFRRETIVIGQSHVPEPEVVEGAAPSEPTVMRVEHHYYNHEPSWGFGYGGGWWGYPHPPVDPPGRPPIGGRPPPTKPPPSQGGTPPVAGDWPAVPNYGPAFPYNTGPADPWQGR